LGAMCLGVVARVVEIASDGVVKVDLGGVTVEALCMVPVEVGDLVVVHAGIVISKLSREEIVENLRIYYELVKYHYVFNGFDEAEASRRAREYLSKLLNGTDVDIEEVLGEEVE